MNGRTAKAIRQRWVRRLAVPVLLCLVLAALLLRLTPPAEAVTVSPVPDAQSASMSVTFEIGDEEGGMDSLRLLGIFVLLALAPSLLIMFTCFTRLVIVLSFVRSAIGLQATPPNQVIIGLALFLSLFIMRPVLTDMNEDALQPYMAGTITVEQALSEVQQPLKQFMLGQTKTGDLDMFLSLSGEGTEGMTQEDLLELPLTVITPAFITSELSRAFMMGFFLYLPFLVIDMVVSSALMSLGMVMLPPSMISLPFKLMLFVVVDGWRLVMEMLVVSYVK